MYLERAHPAFLTTIVVLVLILLHVKSLGAKSRAGFIAYPQLYPKDTPIAKTVRPM